MRGWFMNGFKLAVLAFTLVSAEAWAQAAVPVIEGITAGERDKVAAILGQQQRNFEETCKAVKVLKAETISVAEPVMVDGKEVPTQGRWRVRYAVDACGKAALRMVEFNVVPGGIAIEPLVAGDTLADGKLQVDVTKSFAMAGIVAMPTCADAPVVRDTKVRVFPKTKDDRWQELWIGRMCGRDLGQIVEFLPTDKGTTFKMSLPTASVK